MAAPSTDPRQTARALLIALEERARRPEARSAYSDTLDSAVPPRALAFSGVRHSWRDSLTWVM